MRGRPGKAGLAPADGLQAKRRQRPADRRSKTRNERDAGDRAARGLAIDAPERAEGGIIEAIAHADAEQEPGQHQHPDRLREAEQHEPARKHQIGDRQHRPAADAVDLAADARPEQAGDHQRRRIGAENPVRGDAEIVRDRIGDQRRQIDAGGPGQRLGGAECQDDGELAPAHAVGRRYCYVMHVPPFARVKAACVKQLALALSPATIARHNRAMELSARLDLMNWLVGQGLTGLPETELIRGFCERCCDGGLICRAAWPSSTRCTRSMRGAAFAGTTGRATRATRSNIAPQPRAMPPRTGAARPSITCSKTAMTRCSSISPTRPRSNSR